MMTRLNHELRYYFFSLQQNLKNQQALRLNFMLQIMGMVINNLAFYLIWYFFSKATGSVNGWGTVQMFGMLSISMLVFGITDTLFGSQNKLEDIVPDGRFDALLVRPKNLYTRIIANDFSPSGLGDLCQGLIGLGFFFYMLKPGFMDVMAILCMIVPGCVALISFIMCCNCIIFWLPQTPIIGAVMRDILYLPAVQPIAFLRGKMRLFYMVVVPVMLMGTFPVETITYGRYNTIALTYMIAAVWLVFSIWMLKISVRRYESGNVIG